jgi:tRNA pseudouridine55 synthase
LPQPLHGLVVIDKPAGMTSRAALDRAQRRLPPGTRVGHTGTLDPLATGVLVVCVGAATRLAEYVQRMAKTYRAGIVLGARSDTDDADGVVTPVAGAVAPTLAEVRAALGAFVGAIDQVPPAFSAAHVTGRRAYDLARRGESVELAPRRVQIHAVDIERYDYPLLELTVRCGKGTYIRSLARDLGVQLGCGGYIAALRRTRVGCFDIAEAAALDGDGPLELLPLSLAVAEMPRLEVSAAEATRLHQGQLLPWGSELPDGSEAAVFDERGTLQGVVRVDERGRCLRAEKMLTV